MEAPDAIKWLNELGVEFDKEEDGNMITTHGGGTSRKRMHAAKDYSGAEIMRTIRDEVINRGIPVVEFTSAVELIKDEKGQVAGAVLQNMETGDYLVARAKTVVIATGGAGRMHYQGFPTSNHYGATADGLVLGYRAGAPLFTRILFSIIRQELFIRHRFSELLLQRRFVLLVHSLLTRKVKHISIRWKHVTLTLPV